MTLIHVLVHKPNPGDSLWRNGYGTMLHHILFLQLLVNRSKRKRRRRADKAITGNEKVKLINMRTGKKVGRSCTQA